MTVPLAPPATDFVVELRPSIRIAKLAEAWDCDISQIRDLIKAGELEAHGIGRRGVRVYVDSANGYQTKKTRQPKTTNAPLAHLKPKRRTADDAQHKAAMAVLRRQGLA
jgi:hypothetical protein